MFGKRTLIVIASILLLLGAATPAQGHEQRGGPSRSRAPGQINGHPCGGDLPPCFVLYRESKGTNVKNKRSSASGFWQVINGTWKGYGGYRRAMDAPGNVQDDFARKLWREGKGCSHWNACRR